MEELYLWFYDDPFIYSADGGNLLKTLIDSDPVIENVPGEELADMLNSVKRMEIWPKKTMKGFVVSFTRPEQRILSVFVPVKLDEKLHDLFRLGEYLSLDDLDRMLRKVCNDLLADSMVQAQERDIPENIRMAKDWISTSFTDPGLSVAAIAEKAGRRTPSCPWRSRTPIIRRRWR